MGRGGVEGGGGVFYPELFQGSSNQVKDLKIIMWKLTKSWKPFPNPKEADKKYQSQYSLS